MSGKGLGVVARRDIAQNTDVAYYMGKLLPRSTRFASRFCVTNGNGEIMDIDDYSFPPPEDGVPYVAPYANEPTAPPWTPNCCLCSRPSSSLSERARRYALVTLRAVEEGEELVWDYGDSYGPRDYPSKYSS